MPLENKHVNQVLLQEWAEQEEEKQSSGASHEKLDEESSWCQKSDYVVPVGAGLMVVPEGGEDPAAPAAGYCRWMMKYL